MATVETFALVGGKPQITKDPNATLDYVLDWTDWLAVISDSISAVAWTVPSPLTLVSSSFTANAATVFISGGTAGTTVEVTCRITTAGGRIDDRTFRLKIVEK